MTRIFALLLTLLAPLAAQAESCRQALALGLDVSGSVDAEEYRLQLDGLAAALSHPEVREVLLAPGGAPVHLLVYEWSGPGFQRRIAGWQPITDAAALESFVGALRGTGRAAADPSTALGTALAAGARHLSSREGCWKRTLDISGDGMSNAGPRPQDVKDAPGLADITVNALVIGAGGGGTLASPGDLVSYFETLVIRGPGAFVERASGFADYEQAMRRKLLRELAAVVVGAR